MRATASEMQRAAAEMTAAYKEKFNAEPGVQEIMIINLMSERVAKGETFEWKQNGPNWRTIRLTKPEVKP